MGISFGIPISENNLLKLHQDTAVSNTKTILT